MSAEQADSIISALQTQNETLSSLAATTAQAYQVAHFEVFLLKFLCFVCLAGFIICAGLLRPRS